MGTNYTNREKLERLENMLLTIMGDLRRGHIVTAFEKVCEAQAFLRGNFL